MLPKIREAALREAELRVIAPVAFATMIGLAIALPTAPVTLSAQTIPGAQAESSQALARGEWPAYGGTYAAARYSPLTQIDRSNAKDLHVAWRWKSPDMAIKDGNPKVGPTRANESTPPPAKPNGCSIRKSTKTALAFPPTMVANSAICRARVGCRCSSRHLAVSSPSI